jgi:hypothetical protein
VNYQDILNSSIKNYEQQSPRTRQSRAGILGPSDIGFCRQKAALTTREVEPTDFPSTAAAQIGTAIHRYVGAALATSHPDWIIDDRKVTATLPSGAVISGTPDIIAPDWNAIIDIKTVDGFEWVKRNGVNQNHVYQRHLYALGALQAGLLKEENLLVGNFYIDRSGKEPEGLLVLSDYDPTLTNVIDSWVQDVIYAVKNGETASRDIPAAICERICPFFTACRGELETHDGAEIIDNPELLTALDMYVEGRDMVKEGEKMKREAQSRLYGVNGRSDTYQIRWVEVASTTVDSSEKTAYSRMDVRPVRR